MSRDLALRRAETERLARRRIRYIRPGNSAKILGHSRYWSRPFYELYLEMCDERIFDAPAEGLLLAQNAPELARRIPVGEPADGHYESEAEKAAWRIRGFAVWGSACRAAGALTRAGDAYATAERILEVVEVDPDDEALAELRARRSVLSLTGGRPEDALEDVEEALRIFRLHDNTRRIADSLVIRGSILAGPWTLDADKTLPIESFLRALETVDPVDRRSQRTTIAAVHNIALAIYQGTTEGIAAPSHRLESVFRILSDMEKRLAKRPNSVMKGKIYWLEALILARTGVERFAWRRFQKARRTLFKFGDLYSFTIASIDLALSLLEHDEKAEAEAVLEDFVEKMMHRDSRLVDAIRHYLDGHSTLKNLRALRLSLVRSLR